MPPTWLSRQRFPACHHYEIAPVPRDVGPATGHILAAPNGTATNCTYFAAHLQTAKTLLLRVELDDELLFHRHLDISTFRQFQKSTRQLLAIDL